MFRKKGCLDALEGVGWVNPPTVMSLKYGVKSGGLIQGLGRRVGIHGFLCPIEPNVLIPNRFRV